MNRNILIGTLILTCQALAGTAAASGTDKTLVHSPENQGIQLFCEGGDVRVKAVTGWKMKSKLLSDQAD